MSENSFSCPRPINIPIVWYSKSTYPFFRVDPLDQLKLAFSPLSIFPPHSIPAGVGKVPFQASSSSIWQPQCLSTKPREDESQHQWTKSSASSPAVL